MSFRRLAWWKYVLKKRIQPHVDRCCNKVGDVCIIRTRTPKRCCFGLGMPCRKNVMRETSEIASSFVFIVGGTRDTYLKRIHKTSFVYLRTYSRTKSKTRFSD
jgi:hypothetical protein